MPRNADRRKITSAATGFASIFCLLCRINSTFRKRSPGWPLLSPGPDQYRGGQHTVLVEVNPRLSGSHHLRDTALRDNFALQCGRRRSSGHLRRIIAIDEISVWIQKAHTAADVATWRATPVIPDIRSQSDGRVKQPAAVFSRASDTGHGRALNCTVARKASFPYLTRTAPAPIRL